MSRPFLSVIAAVSTNNIIGNNNALPWDIVEDRRYFKNLTMGHILIMGKKTYESLPRLLDNRIHLVVSSYANPSVWETSDENLYIIPTYTQAYALAVALACENKNSIKEIFAIGGESCYNYFLPICQFLYLTKIHTEVIGDTYFPPYSETDFKQVYRILPEKTLKPYPFEFEFIKYIRK